MTLRLVRSFTKFVDQYRPAFFSRQEWWFHIGMAIILVPVGNSFNFGPHYLTDSRVFLLGTLCGLLLYVAAVYLITMLIRQIIAYYPKYQQTLQRTLVMTLLVNLMALLYNFTEYYLFSLIPLFRMSFSWQALLPMWTMSLVFVSTLCIVVNLLYAYNHWKREQTEVESLKHQVIQQQYDALKQQVKPHFLFNSLSSISALINEDPEGAERFVDDLAKVYRYMLQAGNRNLMPLLDELGFIKTYARLLETRYGRALIIDLPTVTDDLPGYVPPLSLQILVDNALKHNRMSLARPLEITISLVDERNLLITNTLQRKSRSLDVDPHGLANLLVHYHSLTDLPVHVVDEGVTFSVTIPLLTTENSISLERDR